MNDDQLNELARRQPKTRDGKPLMDGATYYTKNGLECTVRLVPVFSVSVNDADGYWRAATNADVFSEPQEQKFHSPANAAAHPPADK